MIRYRRVILRPFEKIVYFVLHSTVLDVTPVSTVVDGFAEERPSRLHVVLSTGRFVPCTGQYRRRSAVKPTAALVAGWPGVAVGRWRRQVEVDAELSRRSCTRWRRRRRRLVSRVTAAGDVPTTSRQRRRPCRSRGGVVYAVAIVWLQIYSRRRLQHAVRPSD